MGNEPDIQRVLTRRHAVTTLAILCNIALILVLGFFELRSGLLGPEPSTLAAWPILAGMQSTGLDLLVFALCAVGCLGVFLLAKTYLRLFPRLDRSGDMWARSAQRPLTTRIRFGVQTVYYGIAGVVVAAFLVSGLVVTTVRFNPVMAALYLNLCFVFLPMAIILVYRAQRRATNGLDADSDLRPDATGRPHAHRLAGLTNAAVVAPGDLPATRRALEQVAIAAGLRAAPALLRFPGHGLNAFVDGVGEHMAIGVSDSFARELSEAEQQSALASLVARGMGSMPDVFAQQSPGFAPSSGDALLDRITQVYLRADHAGVMLTRSPEPMITALARALAAPQGTFIDGLYGNYASQAWVTPVDTNWLVPGREDEATRVAMLARRPEYERIRALKEVVGSAGVVATPSPVEG